MTREQLLKKLGLAWDDFVRSYEGLTERQILESGVTGNWSVKDIIAHVTWWEREAINHLPLILSGGRPQRYSVKYGGIDAFNALMTEKKKPLSLAAVLAEQKETHRELVELIRKIPDEEFVTETRVRRRIRLDCYGHYAIHARAISRWRGRSGSLT